MRLLFLLFILFAWNLSNAHVDQKTYQFGQVNDMQPTDDGGFIVTGLLKTNSNDKCYLMKFDSSGEVSWMKSYSDLIEFYSYGMSVVSLPGEGYICGGIMFHDTISNEQFTLMKCDTAGNLLWSAEYGNTFDDDELSNVLLLNNGILLAGHTTAFGPGGEDFLFVKTDSSGQLQWMKSIGDVNDERCVKIIPYQDGYVAGGYSLSGSNDLFLVFLDSTFNMMSTIEIQIPGKQRMYDLITDASGNLIIAATNEAVNNIPKALFLHYSQSGFVDWCREIQTDRSIPYKIQNSSSGFWVAGATMKQQQHENAFIIEMDALCGIITENYFGDSTGCWFKTLIAHNDTLQLAGNFMKPGAMFPSVYMNKYVANDTTCNHFSGNSLIANVNYTEVSINWQEMNPTSPLITSVVLGVNAAWSDSVVCDFNPYTGELFSQNTFSFSPNPADSKILLDLPEYIKEGTVSIIDVNGQVVHREKLKGSDPVISTSDLIPGIYTIQIRNKSIAASQHMVIQR